MHQDRFQSPKLPESIDSDQLQDANSKPIFEKDNRDQMRPEEDGRFDSIWKWIREGSARRWVR